MQAFALQLRRALRSLTLRTSAVDSKQTEASANIDAESNALNCFHFAVVFVHISNLSRHTLSNAIVDIRGPNHPYMHVRICRRAHNCLTLSATCHPNLHDIGTLFNNASLHIGRARVAKHSITLTPHVHVFALTLIRCSCDKRNLEWTGVCFDGERAKV